MDRDRATFDAFDGVELQLPSGRVVKSPALTVREAVGFMRAPVNVEGGELTEEMIRTIGAHLARFCERIGVADVCVNEVGLKDVDGLDLSGVTIRRGLEIAEQQSIAGDLPDTVEGAGAVLWLLDEVPPELGLPDDVRPDEVFSAARRFRIALYRHLDWLLRRFCEVLTTSPGVRTVALRAPGSHSASTT